MELFTTLTVLIGLGLFFVLKAAFILFCIWAVLAFLGNLFGSKPVIVNVNTHITNPIPQAPQQQVPYRSRWQREQEAEERWQEWAQAEQARWAKEKDFDSPRRDPPLLKELKPNNVPRLEPPTIDHISEPPKLPPR